MNKSKKNISKPDQYSGEKRIKIVFIGAGSNSFGPKIIIDIFSNKDLEKIKSDLVLVDLNKENLEEASRFAKKIAAVSDHDINISSTTDRLQALPGADYVILSVDRRRSQLRDLDLRVPLSLGFKQVTGENGGPGSLFHALRSMELVLPIAKDMEKHCPHAWLFNYTNPVSSLCLALNRLTRIRSVGLCHGVMEGYEQIATILNREEETLTIKVGGINHFYWFTEIRDAESGRDLYPELRQRIEGKPELLNRSVDKGIVAGTFAYSLYKIFDLLPFPTDGHIGEYLPFAHEEVEIGTKWFGQKGLTLPIDLPDGVYKQDPPPQTSRQQWANYRPYIEGDKSLQPLLKKSHEICTNLIADMELNLKKRELAVNAPNKNKAIKNLPCDGIVETAAVVDKEGIHLESVGSLPTAIAELCRRQMAVQDVLVEAYAQRSRHLLLQALLLDPHVDSIGRARKLIDTMFELQGDFLPEME